VSALGIALEVAQHLFLPNRHFDWADIAWSTGGAFVGAAIAASSLQLLKTAN
jgi:VanZ family protein